MVCNQAREMHRLRDRLNAERKERERLEKVERAVNLLAVLRVKRDLQTPRSVGDGPLFGHESVERERVTTYPQALEVELGRIEEAIKDLDPEGLIEDMEETHAAERDALLHALGVDEHEWERVRWKYGV